MPWTPLRVFLLVKQVQGRMGLIYIGAKMDVRGRMSTQTTPAPVLDALLCQCRGSCVAWVGHSWHPTWFLLRTAMELPRTPTLKA